MSATLFVAIGAGIAVLTGIGAGVGIGKACRGNGYLRFRYCPVDHSFPEIIIAIFNRTYGTVRMRGRCSYVKFGTLDNLLDRRQCPYPFCCTSAFSDQAGYGCDRAAKRNDQAAI